MPRIPLSPLILFAALPGWAQEPDAPPPPPIKALLVTGGCSHDYGTRREILVRGIRERLARPIEWVVRLQGEGESDVRIPLFDSSEWAQGYDIVVHDHCFPRAGDPAYVSRVLAPHDAGLPAVLLHGSMMSFRDAGEGWAGFTGATIRSHERERPVLVESVAAHPVLKGFAPWTIPREELYRVERLAPGTAPLAEARDPAGNPHAVVWTRLHGAGKTRVFGTTLGNTTATLAAPRYLDLVARGFLWALGEDLETTFRSVPADESLKGLVLPPDSGETPLRLGHNPALRGKTDAFAWGVGSEAASTAALAVDGDPATAWTSAGPGTWQVELRKEVTLSATAILWQAPPEEALLESSVDGLAWRTLATLRPTEAGKAILTHFEPVAARHFRLSIPKGRGFGLGEFAVYADADDMPAALRMLDPAKPLFRTVARDGFLSRIRLADGWRVGGHFASPVGGRVGQIVPAAFGGVFVSIFPEPEGEGDGSGKVLRVSPNSDGGFDSVEYLAGLAPGSEIAWDGEWLLTLSGGRLNPVRQAIGTGPADERRGAATVYSLPPEGAPGELALRHLRLGEDGWLHADASATGEGSVLDAEGRAVRVPRLGKARFRPDGSGFGIVAGDPSPVGEALSGIGQIQGVVATERDGERLWIAAEEGKQLHFACLVREGDGFGPGPVWDDIPSPELAAWLVEGDRPSIRREAVFEIFRRKRSPVLAFDSLLVTSPPSERAESLAALAAGVDRGQSLDRLLHLSAASDPALRAAAFRAIGDHFGAANHPAFAEIGRTTEPQVSASLFAALQRSRSELPGAEELALALASHPDPGLARAAMEFLLAREAVSVALAALDHGDRREQWPGAFALLGSLRRPDVVEGLIDRIRRTDDPELRRTGLETLCRLYRTDGQGTWPGSEPIAAFLAESLGNHRVDPAALLTTMADAGIPMPEAELLVRLARKNLSLDAFAVASLLEVETTLSSEVLDWLALVADDTSRDGDLRLRAGNLLARHAPAGGSRRRVQETVRRSAIGGATEAAPMSTDEGLSTLSYGSRLFRSLACDTCHNLHGEGPAFGPDLHAAVKALSDEELTDSLRSPDRRIAPGFESHRIERQDGLVLVGRIEERNETVLLFADRAGNLLEVPTSDIAGEWPEASGSSGCGAAADLPEAELTALLDFLRSLGGS